MEIRYYILKDDGIFPNNNLLPLIVYLRAIEFDNGDAAKTIEDIFYRHGWGCTWRNGIHPFHHYHSTAHEVLGIYKGSATICFGGKNGNILEVERGDVILIPAGVAHKNILSSQDFGVIGAYPLGQDWDMNYGKPEERPAADRNISLVPLPSQDPVMGQSGPMFSKWQPS